MWQIKLWNTLDENVKNKLFHASDMEGWMNIGWLLYKREDVEKNRHYINLYVEKFLKYDVEIKTVVLEEEDMGRLAERQKPAFVLNRSRNWEAVKNLEEMGVRVFNRSEVTKIANSKTETYRHLEGIVPFMEVDSTGCGIEGFETGQRDKKFDYPYVIKSDSGHGGNEVFLVNNLSEEEKALSEIGNKSYLKQKCCSDMGRDVRVYILGNNIVKSMLRTSTESFKSNYSLGGSAREYELNLEERDMVEKILERIPMDYGGIDFIFHKGRAIFNEIEDAVGARMLYQAAKTDIVRLYSEYIAEQIGL